MCVEYWPQELNTIFECGNINIILVEEKKYEYYAKRKFEVSYRQDKREIFHIHINWKSENTQLLYSNDALPVVKLIKYYYDNSINPILIHSG